jgi:hypothetical protein
VFFPHRQHGLQEITKKKPSKKRMKFIEKTLPLLLNIALPGRVLCDSSGRKHIKRIYNLK